MYTNGLDFKSGNLVEVLQSIFALILLAPVRLITVISSKIYFLRNEVIEKILLTSCIFNMLFLVLSVVTGVMKSRSIEQLLSGKFPIVFRALSVAISIALYFVIKKFVLSNNNFGLTKLQESIPHSANDSDQVSECDTNTDIKTDPAEEVNSQPVECKTDTTEISLDDALSDAESVLFADPVARSVENFINNFDEERIDDASNLSSEEEKGVSESMLSAVNSELYIKKDVKQIDSSLENLDSLFNASNMLSWDTLGEASEL